MIRISIISAIIAVLAFVLGFGVKTQINKPSVVFSPTERPLITPSVSPLVFSPIPTVQYVATPKATPVSIQNTGWTWKKLGCGSNSPCIYKVCSVVKGTEPIECYSCKGRWLPGGVNAGEKLPVKDENPKTTNNFYCELI